MSVALTPDHSEDTKQSYRKAHKPAPLRGGIRNIMERGLQYPEERWYSRVQQCEATPAAKASEQPPWPFS